MAPDFIQTLGWSNATKQVVRGDTGCKHMHIFRYCSELAADGFQTYVIRTWSKPTSGAQQGVTACQHLAPTTWNPEKLGHWTPFQHKVERHTNKGDFNISLDSGIESTSPFSLTNHQSVLESNTHLRFCWHTSRWFDLIWWFGAVKMFYTE